MTFTIPLWFIYIVAGVAGLAVVALAVLGVFALFFFADLTRGLNNV